MFSRGPRKHELRPWPQAGEERRFSFRFFIVRMHLQHLLLVISLLFGSVIKEMVVMFYKSGGAFFFPGLGGHVPLAASGTGQMGGKKEERQKDRFKGREEKSGQIPSSAGCKHSDPPVARLLPHLAGLGGPPDLGRARLQPQVCRRNPSFVFPSRCVLPSGWILHWGGDLAVDSCVRQTGNVHLLPAPAPTGLGTWLDSENLREIKP